MTQPLFDYEQVREELLPRLSELLDLLGLDFKEDYRSYHSRCPIHDGDKPTALIIYKNSGVWVCLTRQCNEEHGKGIFGLVKAILGLESQAQALSWVCNKLKIKPGIVDSSYGDKHSFASLINSPVKNATKKTYLTRNYIRKELTIPSTYYVGRGHNPTVLNEFDVGDCIKVDKPFYQRAVVPVYDNNWRYSIGFTARSIHPECPQCKMHHDKILDCPPEYNHLYGKWRNSLGFEKSSVLFNYWRAKPAIEQSSTAVLVEGPGDVFKLHAAGVTNCVGILGSDLSDYQKRVLEESGAFDLITMFDMDEAGNKAREVVKNKCGRLFSIKDLIPTDKDVGEMTVEEIKRILTE